MRLKLFSSKKGNLEPNLVAIQAPDLDMLPTMLVCPLLEEEQPTSVRTMALFSDKRYTVLCDLVRPINRRSLIEVGRFDEHTSQRIMATFLLLLAR